MTAFISLILLSSCRETEEIVTETNGIENQTIGSRATNDSIYSHNETNQSNPSTNGTTDLEVKEPEKDKIKW